MSSVTKNAIDGYSSIGRRLNEFLYDGRVKDNVKREHTKEELEQMLEDILKGRDRVKIIISALNTNEQNMFFKGYGEEKSKKGLGSGALTGTNRIPLFTNSTKKAKEINNFIDAKRIMTEIIDSIKYEEIYNIKMISIHFLESEGVE